MLRGVGMDWKGGGANFRDEPESGAGKAFEVDQKVCVCVCVCMFLEFSNNYFDFENVKNHLQIFRTDCTLCLSVELGNLWCSFTPTPFLTDIPFPLLNKRGHEW